MPGLKDVQSCLTLALCYCVRPAFCDPLNSISLASGHRKIALHHSESLQYLETLLHDTLHTIIA